MRARIILWYVLMLAVGLGLALFTIRTMLVAQMDQRIERDLVQEVEELRSLTDGRDPQTGELFGDDLARIFEVFLSRNVPLRHETFITYLDGAPFRRSADDPPIRLDLQPALAERWRDVEETERGSADLDDVGRIEYLAVPVNLDGQAQGVFVVASFRDMEIADFHDGINAAIGVAVAVLLVASLIAWNVSGQVLRPVRSVTSTAQRITDTDLARRIPVRGADEVSQLARTFNQMLDRLETAFVSQRAFIDDAGHELRTPITIISGHLELLDHTDPDDRQETLELVMDELGRMHRIVEDLLLLAKSDQPSFLTMAPVDAGGLTRSVHAKAQALADREWRLGEVADGVGLRADGQRLTQAMVQIAQNAVQHTGHGDPITIGSGVRDDRLRLWVRDTGPGVSAADRECIFGRFARGSAPGRRGEGAGLGLAIVWAIADAHHGIVTVDSRVGAGATFAIDLPLDGTGAELGVTSPPAGRGS